MRPEIINYDTYKEVFLVQFVPNWLEKLFGYETTTQRFKHNDEQFLDDLTWCWYDYDTGEQFGRFPMLDEYLRLKEWKG